MDRKRICPIFVLSLIAALCYSTFPVEGFVSPTAIKATSSSQSARSNVNALMMMEEESIPSAQAGGSTADVDGIVIGGAMDGFEPTAASSGDTQVTVAADALSSLASSTDSPIVDLDTVALVVGQENYGLAVVLLGEALWSFFKAPSVDHGVKTLLPAIVAAAVLGAVSGPMVTSGDAASVATGLGIATAVSMFMGAVYVARLTAPFSPSPKEIPALGLLVAVAGFFSFSQNLVVDGFVTLPSLPSLPSLPTIDLPF
jgi:hypothetical protein